MNTTIELIQKYANERIAESDKVIAECDKKWKERLTSQWLESYALELVFHEELKRLWNGVVMFTNEVEENNLEALMSHECLTDYLRQWKDNIIGEIIADRGSRCTNHMSNLIREQWVNAKKEFVGHGFLRGGALSELIVLLKKEAKGE